MLLCLVKVGVMNTSYTSRRFYSGQAISINVINAPIYTFICSGGKGKILLKSSINNTLILIINILMEEKCIVLLLKIITTLDAELSMLLLEGKIKRLTHGYF